MLKCPYCGSYVQDLLDKLPQEQEERVFVKCRSEACEKVFAAWWCIEHSAERIEDGGPYDGAQAAEIAETAAE